MTSRTALFNDKEAEAIMWMAGEIADRAHTKGLDARHPVAQLRQAGYHNKAIKRLGIEMEDIAGDRQIPAVTSPMLRLALKMTVENTSWIGAYREGDPTKDSPAHINEALTTLRSLAAKFEEHGVEINHIPFD